MLRKVAIFSLAIGFFGCGGGDKEALELQSYVDKIKALDGLNQKIASESTRINEPSIEITATDLVAARALISQYMVELGKIGDIEYNSLRRSYDSYLRKVEQATELAADSGRELKRERGNVVIGLRHIEKVTIMHYQSAIDLLWTRQKIESTMPLKWPE
jgi:hypothetical protein